MESEQLAQFCGVTGATRDEAHQYLAESNWDLHASIQKYFDNTEGNEDAGGESNHEGSQIADRVLRQHMTPLSSDPQAREQAPQPSTSARDKRKAPPKATKKFGTLQDLNNESNQEDDSDKEQEFYAGGDKSGLAVQDPSQQPGNSRDNIQRLIETARRNGPPPPQEAPGQRSTFQGAAQTLGGDDVPSRRIPAANEPASRPRPLETRILHLWADGFSVDDGPLYRYDDPANARMLDQINNGSAPIGILNVQPGQDVDVKLDPHRDQKYVPPKKTAKAFAGSGTRLGSPTPGPSSSSGSNENTKTSQTPPTQSAASSTPTMELDETQPTITLQIRLADGTRLPSRFNPTHTIGDVYDFVNRANEASSQRAYSLATTFPTKELNDKSHALGDLAEFKRAAVVVQKWQ